MPGQKGKKAGQKKVFTDAGPWFTVILLAIGPVQGSYRCEPKRFSLQAATAGRACGNVGLFLELGD